MRHPVLAWSARDIKRWSKAQTPVLWGSATRRQFGSPTDLFLARLERERYHAFLRQSVAMARLVRAINTTAAELGRRMLEISRAVNIKPEDLAVLGDQVRALGK